jgi:hypothetical protein
MCDEFVEIDSIAQAVNMVHSAESSTNILVPLCDLFGFGVSKAERERRKQVRMRPRGLGRNRYQPALRPLGGCSRT